jgi:hypothetical protein
VPTFHLDNIFPKFNAYERLERLELMIHYTRRFKHHISPFSVIFTRMPNLKHLYLKIHDSIVSCASLGDVIRPPPLRTLHLEDCPYFAQDSLCAVIEFLSRSDSWGKFENLWVTNCALLGNCQDAVSKWLEPDKVKVDNDECECEDEDEYGNEYDEEEEEDWEDDEEEEEEEEDEEDEDYP